MFVYFVRCLGTEFVKIGKARNVETRLNSLQTGCPFDLALMFKIRCDSEKAAYELEGKLHKMFGEQRRRAEWFKIRGSQLSRITKDMDTEVQVAEFNDKFVTPRELRRKRKRK